MRKALFKVDVGVFCIIGYLSCLFVCRFLRDPNSPSEWHPCLFRTVGGFAFFTDLADSQLLQAMFLFLTLCKKQPCADVHAVAV